MLLTNGVAILSDALHHLGDSLAVRLGRVADSRFSFGYRHFSLLAALIGVAVMAAAAVLILTETVPRMFTSEPVHTTGMLLFAVAGLVIKSVAVWRLRDGAGANVRVVRLHLMEDVLGRAAVLALSTALQFWELYILDPIPSILVAGCVPVSIVRWGLRTVSLLV